jgi:penicillin amidase
MDTNCTTPALSTFIHIGKFNLENRSRLLSPLSGRLAAPMTAHRPVRSGDMSLACDSVSPARRRLRTATRWALTALCASALVISSTVAWGVRRSYPQLAGELRLPGLTAAVEVHRDSWGVPQIYAGTSADLFAAQGYVHAQDRFFEMDFRRHVTAGRLSELFGESQFDTDATIRTMGWRRVAEQEWDLLDDNTKRYFQSYADGVNAYLAGKSPDDVSLEYTMLGFNGLEYRIEPWQPVDSLAWLKAMAWDLRGNYSDELGRAQLAAAGLSDDQISELYPPYPQSQHAPIVAEGTVVDGEFSAEGDDGETRPRLPAALTGSTGQAAVEATREATDTLTGVLGAGGADGIGSNSWVVSGELSQTGKPILANDPHLGPAMPSVWYQAGLHCTTIGDDCPFEVTGFSFSGVPGIMIGHNGQIAWGFTNLGPDVTDFYIERLKGDKYQVAGKWHDLAVREETIKVAGGESRTISVRSTGHGPLMSDRGAALGKLAADPPTGPDPEDGAEYGIALRWTALDPGRTASAIFALNTATDVTEFRAAAERFDVPAQNLIYADRDGNIAYQSPGRIPLRDKGDGTVPVPGWDRDYDWQGFIEFDELPTVTNPDEGFIVTANNQVIADQYPYLLTKDWAYGYRSQRIRDMITEAGGKISVADMNRMQLDSTNTGAPAVVDKVLTTPAVSSSRLCDLLADWDYRQPWDSTPAAVYNVLWRHLLLDVFDELPTGMKPGGGERWAHVMAGLLDDPDNPWWDDQSTSEVEDMEAVIAKALAQADIELSERFGDDPAQWIWGELHTLTVTHQSLGTSGIGWIEDVFNAPPVMTGGGDGLVNATGWNAAGDYTVDAVPSMRMVVDMSDLDDSTWVNLTGNSGHAFNPHYRDQLPLWRDGTTLPMNWSGKQIKAATQDRLRLVP